MLGNNTDPTWHVVGTGDFTGNGTNGILFQNANSGQVFEWQLNGTSTIASGAVGNNTDPTWHVVGALAILPAPASTTSSFRMPTLGRCIEWEMNGTSVIGSGFVGNNTDPTWKVVGTGDFTGSGTDGILFQNVNSGQVYEWQVNGMSVVASGFVGNNTNPTWHAKA